jgi:hypothetical protein
VLDVLAVDGSRTEEQHALDRSRRERFADVGGDRQVLREDVERVAELLLDRRANHERGVRLEQRLERPGRIRPREIKVGHGRADDGHRRRRLRKRRRQTPSDVAGVSEQDDPAELRLGHQARLPTQSANR